MQNNRVHKCREVHKTILLGSLSTKQIRPPFIGLQRDSPPHETFSDLQQRYK